MTEQHSITDARRNLQSPVRDAEHRLAVKFTRRREFATLPVGHRESGRLASGRRGFGNAYRAFANTFDLTGLALDPDELFGDARADTAGHHGCAQRAAAIHRDSQ